MRELVANGADVDKATTDTGRTPLFIASYNRNLCVVRVLIKNGADVELISKSARIGIDSTYRQDGRPKSEWPSVWFIANQEFMRENEIARIRLKKKELEREGRELPWYWFDNELDKLRVLKEKSTVYC